MKLTNLSPSISGNKYGMQALYRSDPTKSSFLLHIERGDACRRFLSSLDPTLENDLFPKNIGPASGRADVATARHDNCHSCPWLMKALVANISLERRASDRNFLVFFIVETCQVSHLLARKSASMSRQNKNRTDISGIFSKSLF